MHFIHLAAGSTHVIIYLKLRYSTLDKEILEGRMLEHHLSAMEIKMLR